MASKTFITVTRGNADGRYNILIDGFAINGVQVLENHNTGEKFISPPDKKQMPNGEWKSCVSGISAEFNAAVLAAISDIEQGAENGISTKALDIGYPKKDIRVIPQDKEDLKGFANVKIGGSNAEKSLVTISGIKLKESKTDGNIYLAMPGKYKVQDSGEGKYYPTVNILKDKRSFIKGAIINKYNEAIGKPKAKHKAQPVLDNVADAKEAKEPEVFAQPQEHQAKDSSIISEINNASKEVSAFEQAIIDTFEDGKEKRGQTLDIDASDLPF